MGSAAASRSAVLLPKLFPLLVMPENSTLQPKLLAFTRFLNVCFLLSSISLGNDTGIRTGKLDHFILALANCCVQLSSYLQGLLVELHETWFPCCARSQPFMALY